MVSSILARATLMFVMGTLASGATATQLDYRLYRQSFDPAHPNVSSVTLAQSLPGGLSSDLGIAWSNYINGATPTILKNIQAADWVKPGYTLYNARLNIPAIDSIDVIGPGITVQPVFSPTSPNHVRLSLHCNGARLDADSTTDFTNHANDPSFHVTFDLTANIDVGVGPTLATVTVSDASVTFSDATYTPDNASAKLAAAIDAFRSFFGAQTTADRVAELFDSNTIDLTGYISKVAQQVQQNLTRNLFNSSTVAAGVFLDSSGLSFVIAPRVAANAAGVMHGELVVTGTAQLAALGAPAGSQGGSSCGSFLTVHDWVQVQPPYLLSLNPLAFSTAPTPTQTLDGQITFSGGQIQATQQGWSCSYQVSGLASGFANNISFTAAAGGSASSPNSPVISETSVTFSPCVTAGGSGGLVGSTCLRPTADCASPLDVPVAPGAACNLLGTVSLVNAGRPNLQQQLTAQPLPSGGDPANRWGTVQTPSVGLGALGGAPISAPATSLQHMPTQQVKSAFGPGQAPVQVKPLVGSVAP